MHLKVFPLQFAPHAFPDQLFDNLFEHLISGDLKAGKLMPLALPP
jgi:hypothetical protein